MGVDEFLLDRVMIAAKIPEEIRKDDYAPILVVYLVAFSEQTLSTKVAPVLERLRVERWIAKWLRPSHRLDVQIEPGA